MPEFRDPFTGEIVDEKEYKELKDAWDSLVEYGDWEDLIDYEGDFDSFDEEEYLG